MDAKKAGLPAALLASALGGYAVGQKAAAPTPAHVVKLRLEDDGRATVVVRAREVYELACGPGGLEPQVRGAATPKGAALCKAAAAFAAAAAPAALELGDPTPQK